MDLTETLAPKSDQLDAVDLVGGSRIFTITDVSKGSIEQPVNIGLAEFPRVWRPSKGMRRALVAAWGPNGSTYKGRRVELFCDPEVQFGGEKVGGVRIRAMSHIDGPLEVVSLIKRGKGATITIQPLRDEPAVASKP